MVASFSFTKKLMESIKLFEAIERAIQKNPHEYQTYKDMFDLCVGESSNPEMCDICHTFAYKLRQYISRELKTTEQVQEFYDLYKNSLLFDASYSFDAYMQFLELDRKPQERFYQPRRKILKPLVDAIQDLADDKLDELFLSMPPRCGKLLADSTPVLTTKGWKNHGDLKVGDMVYSPEGYPVPVIGVLPKYHTTHTVTFSDGSKIKCHYNHQWKVIDRSNSSWKPQIKDTKDLIKFDNSHLVPKGKRGHRYRFMLPNRKPIEGTPQKLLVDPYVLGVWLGDGTNQAPKITGIDEPIFNAISSRGYVEDHRYIHKETGVTSCVYRKLGNELRQYDMCHSKYRSEKYIPEAYLCAPINDRLELLAGLIDTDGDLSKKENRYHFTTADEKLKNTFIELIATFGWRCSTQEIEPKISTSGIKGEKKYWAIGFNPTMVIPCRLERKQLNTFSKQRMLSIVNVEESEPEQGNCITVFGGMYCVGKNMIPTHNTTMLLFFVTWMIGRNPESTNLYSAFSDNITNMFYTGLLEVLKDQVTYKWHEIFPTATLASTNSKDETLDINRLKKYHTFTARSLYGTLNGSCDCNGILIADDLLSGIEEALSPDRLNKAWMLTDNNLLARAKENAKILWVGTRWSINDPIGKRIDIIESNPKFANRRYRVINVPALNDNDESNFDYQYGVGFSTEYYQQKRASFERNNDLASWDAQYMGSPIEREGTLFAPDGFRYYNGELPEETPDRIFMACDPAWGGGDSVAAPICYQYGDDIYVHDVVFTKEDKSKSWKMLADAIMKNNVHTAQFEGTKATETFSEGVQDLLKKKDYRCNFISKPASTKVSKEQRIFDKAPDIRELMIFRDSSHRDKDYNLFLMEVFSFKMEGKNKHDDAPDSLAMAMDMVLRRKRKVEVFQRPF